MNQGGHGNFLKQCKAMFGNKLGIDVWEAVNGAFDCLPIAALIDGHIFCAHGGICRRFQARYIYPIYIYINQCKIELL